MEEKTEKAQQKIPEFEEYARQAKEEYDGAMQLKELERLKNQMEPMVAWAQVAAKEREHAQLEEEARTADEGLGQVQERQNALLADLAKLEAQLVESPARPRLRQQRPTSPPRGDNLRRPPPPLPGCSGSQPALAPLAPGACAHDDAPPPLATNRRSRSARPTPSSAS